MTQEEMMREFKRLRDVYEDECRLNGGREGTVLACVALAQLTLMQKLLIEYCHVNADAVKIVRHV